MTSNYNKDLHTCVDFTILSPSRATVTPVWFLLITDKGVAIVVIICHCRMSVVWSVSYFTYSFQNIHLLP